MHDVMYIVVANDRVTLFATRPKNNWHLAAQKHKYLVPYTADKSILQKIQVDGAAED